MSRILITALVGLLINCPGTVFGQRVHTRSTSRPPSPSSKELTAEQIAKKYLPGVVLLVCDDGKGTVSQGSGFFVRNGEILTNHHVVKGMARGKAKVAMGGSQAKEWWITALLFIDEKNDLALLSTNPEPERFEKLEIKGIGFGDDKGNLQPRRKPISKPLDLDALEVPNRWEWVGQRTSYLRLSEATTFKVGETVYILSNPRGLTGTISRGMISGGLRRIGDTDLLQFDAPISAGSSGGAVLNSSGEVIGIATASLAASQNLNFAVPVTTIRVFLDNSWKWDSYPSLTSGKIEKGWKNNSKIAEQSKGVAPSSPVKVGFPSWKQIESMSYEDVVRELTNALRHSSFKHSDKYVLSVSSIGFSGCTMTFQKSTRLNETFWRDSYVVNLRDVADFGGTSFSKETSMAIWLKMSRKALEQTDFGLFEGPYNASFVEEISVPITANDNNAISLIFMFKRLKETCTDSAADGRASQWDTAEWLTQRIEGTTALSGDISTKYERVRFSYCNLSLTKRVRSGGSEFLETSQPDLKTLQKVEVDQNKSGIWGVWLTFRANFDVTTQTLGYFGSTERGRGDKVVLFFDSYEKAKRAGTAFARVLELCGEETKDPF